MPRISAFYGIVITMYWETGGQHHAAHFHATYGEHEASIGIEPLVVLDGSLPVRALGHVMEWAALHEHELRDNWQRVIERTALASIEPRSLSAALQSVSSNPSGLESVRFPFARRTFGVSSEVTEPRPCVISSVVAGRRSACSSTTS